MLGFTHAKSTLGFDKVLNLIAQNAVSELGKQTIKNSAPIIDRPTLEKELGALNELLNIHKKIGLLPLYSFSDLRILLNKIEPANSFLDVKECLQVKNLLEIASDLKRFFKNPDLAGGRLQTLINNTEDLKNLISQLKHTIDPSGNIYDNASSELKNIRKKLNQHREEVNKKLEHIRAKNSVHLQEDFVTLREGRLVLPVREFSVSKIDGIVHGQSASGSTRYVEPIAVVQINNQIQELNNAEKREIVRILTRLAAVIKENRTELETWLDLLVKLDVLQAKGHYAKSVEAIVPQLGKTLYWYIEQAKHPLLLDITPETTVPLNLEIGEEYRMLIISGPNAGGKTVAMKTVGLLQLMLQSAIPVPVAENSTFPIIEQLFVVIGDKQSIENDLSTFSSHITGLKEILEKVDHNALVLIDEIGNGTEPSGGAALAVAVLEKLNRYGIVTLVSTHQNQLKLYASDSDMVENGAMQFDTKSLKPLFILETGVPGSSFTFDICTRFNLPKDVIKHAREIEGQSNQNLDELLNDIAEKSAFYQTEMQKISVKQSKLDGLLNMYESRAAEQKKKARKWENEAKQQAQQIIKEANKKIETVIRSIKESAADKDKVKQLRSDLEKHRKNITPNVKQKQIKSLSLDEIKVGMRVKALNYNIIGVISKVFKNKKSVELEREGVKLNVKLSELEILSKDGLVLPIEEKGVPQTAMPAIAANKLDIRGLQVQEAVQELDAYLDNVAYSEWSEVTIVHGKGGGILRQAVQNFLKKNRLIESFRNGKYGEGDGGVTIVTLKK